MSTQSNGNIRVGTGGYADWRESFAKQGDETRDNSKTVKSDDDEKGE